MRTGSQSGPDTAVLDKQEFYPPCDCVLVVTIFRPIMLWRCKNPARWAAHNPCCGNVMLSCPKHRDNIPNCKRCNRIPCLLRRWSRI